MNANDLDFQPPELWDNTFWLFKSPTWLGKLQETSIWIKHWEETTSHGTSLSVAHSWQLTLDRDYLLPDLLFDSDLMSGILLDSVMLQMWRDFALKTLLVFVGDNASTIANYKAGQKGVK